MSLKKISSDLATIFQTVKKHAAVVIINL